MMSNGYECLHCGKDDFKSQRGLTQHQAKSSRCSGQVAASDENLLGYFTADEGMTYHRVINEQQKSSKTKQSSSKEAQTQAAIDKNLVINRMLSGSANNNVTTCQPCGTINEQSDGHTGEENSSTFEGYTTAMENNNVGQDYNNFYDNDDNFAYDDNEDMADEDNNADENNDSYDPKEELMHQFREYCEEAKHFLPFTRRQRIAIQCMEALRKTKASLLTYDAIMKWHLRATGELGEFENAGETPEFISRKKLIKLLKKRYNIEEEFYGIQKTIQLPTSNTCVTVVTNDAGTMIRSLLTDPRVSDDDYLFFDNDPFAPQPEDLDYLGDLNTGLSYKETYKARVTKPGKQILCPVQMYADGCATGQFANLNITQFKIALGIHNAKARNKHYL